MKALFDEKERKARMRSLGNIRFIGELYKLEMLTAKIMHECVQKLLKCVDEESLECLCRLLSTIGKNLEDETIKRMAGKEQGPVSLFFLLKHFFRNISFGQNIPRWKIKFTLSFFVVFVFAENRDRQSGQLLPRDGEDHPVQGDFLQDPVHAPGCH